MGFKIVESTDPSLLGWTGHWDLVDEGPGRRDLATLGGLDTLGSPPDCNSFTRPVIPVDSGDVQVMDAQPPTRRMVGKGTVISASGQRASYAYIVGCTLSGGSPPFEVHFGARRLRLLTASVVCFDDPAVPTPAAGFDTQTGEAFFFDRDSTSTGEHISWRFVDGGPGGTHDSAAISIGSPPFFTGFASPPGKFPGSTQTTGFNTAQLLP